MIYNNFKFNNFNKTDNFVKVVKITNLDTKLQCNHIWINYIGLIEVYQYCKNCKLKNYKGFKI
jgi:hypothetical protein